MTCGTCGKWIPEGHERCPYCRAPVRRPGLLERLFGRLTLARRREKVSDGKRCQEPFSGYGVEMSAWDRIVPFTED